jgi:hypothetical protein
MSPFIQGFKDWMLITGFVLSMFFYYAYYNRTTQMDARIRQLEQNIKLLNMEHPGYGYSTTYD